jgi:hypothetical protein
MSLIGILGLGFAPSGGGDYPSANNVRSGITYNSGAATGNLVLPVSYNVLLGVGYGASGTEVTGTYNTGLPSAPSGSDAPQSFKIGLLLDAIGFKVRVGTQLGSRVIEWNGDSRPAVEGDTVITYRLNGINPQHDAGAGVKGTPVVFEIEVTVYSIKRTDATGNNQKWNRYHWGICTNVITALHGKMLAWGYNPSTGAALGPWATTGTVQFEPSASNIKPTDKQDWGASKLIFSVPTQLPVVVS